jgi:hypothetical protein
MYAYLHSTKYHKVEARASIDDSAVLGRSNTRNHGFESRLRHECILCHAVLNTRISWVGCLNKHLKSKIILVFIINSESEMARGHSIHSFIHSFIHSSLALQPFVEPWPLLQFRNLFYTDGWTPWAGDQPVARPLPTYRTTQTQNKRTHTHPYPEWDSNPRSQRSSERRQFVL